MKFVRSVWASVVAEQDEEITCAIYGQSSRYHLLPDAKYLEVKVEDWYNWSFKKARTVRKQILYHHPV